MDSFLSLLDHILGQKNNTKNIKKAIPDVSDNNLKKITEAMWNNYGRVFAEYIFIKEFRIGKLSNQIDVDGKDILDEIIKTNSQVVFISGHLVILSLWRCI